MAAGIFEINSFVHKFVNLWQAGRNASLKLDSQAGQASVTLHLDLGQAVPPQHVQNARERRRQRRADARQANAAETANMGANIGKENAVDGFEVNEHRVTCSPIPLNEGACDLDVLQPTYCKICEECPEEMETSEDVNYHVMNNHETKLVYEKYGKLWVEERRYCIRRNSPFNKEI